MSAVVISIEGVKVKSASKCRFIVVKVIRDRASMKVLSASVEKRSDSLPVARKHVSDKGVFIGEEQHISRMIFDSAQDAFVPMQPVRV